MKRSIVSKQTIFFLLSFICTAISWIGWWLHFSGQKVGNPATWVFWLFSIVFFFSGAIRWGAHTRKILPQKKMLLLLVTTIIFLFAHVPVFTHAPWNTYGLFDDAAWDIYFAHNHVVHGMPFQAAYFDSVGYISREVVFHYYITVVFQLFGYNLFVFTVGLILLGYATVIGIVLLVQQLLNRYWISACIGILVIFWPLFYMHIFMGHRYAIAVPTLVWSLYFLYSGMHARSKVRVILSAVFAALCFGSSVMGKQYIYALIFGVCMLLVSKKGRSVLVSYGSLLFVWCIGFIIASTPLLAYIAAFPTLYGIRETGLVREFISSIKDHGTTGITPYWNGIIEIFFAPFSGRRQFIGGFPVIPLPYLLVIVPGLLRIWKRRRYELVAISCIPIIAAFVSGAYDFRILFAFPGWVLACAYALDFVWYSSTSQVWGKRISMGFMICTLIAGYIPALIYIYDMAGNPNGQYLLPHADVAVSRLVQDIAAGEEHPSIAMKWNEFNRSIHPHRPYDLFVSPANSYAIMHLYLQNFDDKKILSFTDGGIQRLLSENELFSYNKRAILSYESHGKDLKLIWERTEKSQQIRDLFADIAPFALSQTFTDSIDGHTIQVDVLTVPSDHIIEFQDEVGRLPMKIVTSE